VIMKCLQKRAAKRFQSIAELEIALARAAIARPGSPWEAAINRGLTRTELEIRNRLRQGAERAKTFLESQDWRSLIRIQEDPKAMLGVTGLVGALTVFLFFGGWKPRTINAQTVQVASQDPLSRDAAVNGSFPGFTTSPPQNSFNPILSHEVDLNADSRTANGKTLPSDPGSPNDNLGSEPATPPAASPKRSPIIREAKSPVLKYKQKAQPDAQHSAQVQALASPTQAEILTSVSATRSVGQEPATNSSQPMIVPEPAAEQAILANLPKTGGDGTKAPKLYFEVGTFKDETWANNAVDKLTQLGFHAVLIHKNLLWSQSYHVQVGPYTNQKDIAEARQDLASQGFKAHPVN
jgi:cell division protein FtsN